MIVSYWHSAHQHVVARLSEDLQPASMTRYMICGVGALAFVMASAALIFFDVPMRFTMISIATSVAFLIVPIIYIFRIVSYPARQYADLVDSLDRLKRRLDRVGATEGVLIRLSELLFWAKQLQLEDVRSEPQLDEWTERYQTIVQIIYSELNSNVSLNAATAFVAHPVLKPCYSRGCLNDRHRKMKLLLDHYVIKLASLIDGYYVHLSGHSHCEEPSRRIAA